MEIEFGNAGDVPTNGTKDQFAMKLVVGLIGMVLLFGTSSVNAQSERSQGSTRRGIQASGLVPIFPKDAACTTIASPYASFTRYDGSARPRGRFGGLHGGIDLTLDEGTPVLAIAAGKVIAAGTGGQAEGVYVWLQHAPQDTGLPFWVYSKYQHLSVLPKHAIGDVLKAGDAVALSGNTGTVGGHYGLRGYAHLHLTTLGGPSERYETEGSRIVAEGSQLIDPLAIFAQGLGNVDDIEQLSADQKKVNVSYVAKDGSIHPAGSRTVWPVACK